MIGQIFTLNNNTYKFKSVISTQRSNADIYLCENGKGKEFVAKYYCNRTPVSVVGYSKYNHYGRGRDGSHHVFSEVKAKSEEHDFLLGHFGRVKHNGKWLILLEYIDGQTIDSFIREKYSTDFPSVKAAVKALAQTLSIWHNNGFAHGDPHLENAMISSDFTVKLIDYGQIHHKDFEHCNSYYCIKDNELIRMSEDLENDSNKLGNGFRYGLFFLQKELGLDSKLVDIFNDNYQFALIK